MPTDGAAILYILSPTLFLIATATPRRFAPQRRCDFRIRTRHSYFELQDHSTLSLSPELFLILLIAIFSRILTTIPDAHKGFTTLWLPSITRSAGAIILRHFAILRYYISLHSDLVFCHCMIYSADFSN
jgi:hypothetical protein